MSMEKDASARRALSDMAAEGSVQQFSAVGRVVVFILHNCLLLMGAITASLAAAVVYLFVVSPAYTARAQLLIDAQVSPLLREQLSSRTPLDIAQVESQIAVLRSEQIALPVSYTHLTLPTILRV